MELGTQANWTCPGAHGLFREVRGSALHSGRKARKALLTLVLAASSCRVLSYRETATLSPLALQEGISLFFSISSSLNGARRRLGGAEAEKQFGLLVEHGLLLDALDDPCLI